MLTLAQVKRSSVANVAGVNIDDAQFAQYVNDAVRQLMDIGSWWGTVQAMMGCVYDNRIVWPAKVGSILGMRTNCHELNVSNYWYDFVPVGGLYLQWAKEWNCGNRRGSVVEFSGTTPLFKHPSPANPFIIRFIPETSSDAGKLVTVYGHDMNGHELITVTPGGTQRGLTVQLGGNPPNADTPMITKVTAITKDLTVGNVQAWKFLPNAGLSDMVGLFRGGDTSPQFLYSHLPMNSCVRSISALVKLGYVEVSQDSDILPLDSLDAIKSMVQAIRKRESGDDQAADKFEATAIRRLNMQMRTRFPIEQFVLSFNPFGEDRLEKQKIGSML